MIIDGKRVCSGRTFRILNPYTNDVVGKAVVATSSAVSRALRLCYRKKKGLSPDEGAGVLRSAAKELAKRKKEFAECVSRESGLCLKDTLHEVERTVGVLGESAKVASSMEKDITGRFEKRKGYPKLKVIGEPFDLSVAITPFNHPINQIAHKICPAIAAGANVVVKPSEKTPLSAIEFVGLLHEQGLPANSINLVTGFPPREIVRAIVTNPLVQMVAFTGGIGAGREIQKMIVKSGRGNVRQVFELGGTSPFVVCEDADIGRAVGIAMSTFRNSGQRCTNIRKIILFNKIAEQFVQEFVEKASGLKYGNPLEMRNDMGTLIDEESAKRVQGRVRKAIAGGARLLLGNEREGALYSPTILDFVPRASELVVKETFGPVAPIIRVNSMEQVRKAVTVNDYRLAGSIATSSRKTALEFADWIRVGQFSWNGSPGYRAEWAPFGGFGDSGNACKEGVVLGAEGYRRIRTFYEH
ncbi:MAG: aldehyde dehydrogenase family protein [Candidatus Micrarchaeota archaeon]